MWREQTGLKKNAFYDRLREARADGLGRRDVKDLESRKVGNGREHFGELPVDEG